MASNVRRRSRPRQLESAGTPTEPKSKEESSSDPTAKSSKSSTITANDDYEVGYRRPPKSTQFKPGQSGNPKGRPKGTKNIDTLIERELDKKVTVKENGVARTVRKRDLMVAQLVNNAAKGDYRAIQTMTKAMESTRRKADVREDAPDKADDNLSGVEDQAILARFIESITERTRRDEEVESPPDAAGDDLAGPEDHEEGAS